MKKTLRLGLAAAAAIAIVAAVGCGKKKKSSQPQSYLGGISMAITTCTGNCGKQGRFHARFYLDPSCQGTPAAYHDDTTDLILTSSAAPISVVFPMTVPQAATCSTVYFDVNTNGVLDTGDAIPANGTVLTGTVNGALGTAGDLHLDVPLTAVQP